MVPDITLKHQNRKPGPQDGVLVALSLSQRYVSVYSLPNTATRE